MNVCREVQGGDPANFGEEVAHVQLPQSTQNEELIDKFSSADKKQLGDAVTEAIQWLDVSAFVRGEAERGRQPDYVATVLQPAWWIW